MTTETPLEAAVRYQGQEPCPVCPKGIVSCAHLGDRVVWLDDAYVESNGGHAGRATPWSGERWHVVGPAAVVLECGCGKEHPTLPGPFFLTDSLPEAEAEYERRCALLRAEA